MEVYFINVIELRQQQLYDVVLNRKEFWHYFAFSEEKQIMERQQENNGGKRRRKIITTPVLVRSVKPSGTVNADYTKTNHTNPFWRAA
jgi:hypothetical protein